ncbi:hypothetical protein [Faecalibacter rhinopitheci]|uniref:DUF2116 family Zn-ribbon domain-containing protein n=1 Tax=Faecalibacter rhinopitheci TaxID=2779678 RepID=A0A8J7K9C2_9FLAO|nr:hypothetical protein [Faecalibacter rhinopitheci]MBF0595870.1 hypothetical protein [Faecalibacter rhinopitheci]MBQ0148967.1 hypothetical protein [Candidatus Onthonaster equi]
MKTCIQCGQTLFGRKDKKFCNDFCRNTYNNQLNKENVEVIRITNNRLKKNHKILKNLYDTEKSTVTYTELELLGFDLNLITSYEFNEGVISRKVYDYLLEQKDDKLLSLKQIS